MFVINACDREIIAWSAVANASISGEMVCDLMIAAVERRFQGLKIPHRLEWLSDNDSAYIARQTAQIAVALGIDLLFTPVRSPQSNGRSEAVRQNPEKGLCLDRHPPRRRHHPGLAARLDRRLQSCFIKGIGFAGRVVILRGIWGSVARDEGSAVLAAFQVLTS